MIFTFSDSGSPFKILQYVVMPDHIHFLLFVTSPLPEPAGYYIARWKVRVNAACGLGSIFETGFNDQILTRERSLKTLVDYIRDNPRRLIVRSLNRDYFRRVNDLTVAGSQWQAYGNMQLLENPFKEQVVIHRADTPQVCSRNRERWLYTAANGGVLVSPFISPGEKAIRREAEALGSKMIVLTNEAFSERYKPAAHDFDLCTAGRLLIISPKESLPATRETFLRLNALAKTLSAC